MEHYEDLKDRFYDSNSEGRIKKYSLLSTILILVVILVNTITIVFNALPFDINNYIKNGNSDSLPLWIIIKESNDWLINNLKNCSILNIIVIATSSLSIIIIFVSLLTTQMLSNNLMMPQVGAIMKVYYEQKNNVN